MLAWPLLLHGIYATDESELFYVFLTVIMSLTIMVLLGAWWERRQ